jgi:flagellar hook-basal body complex protein FliE
MTIDPVGFLPAVQDIALGEAPERSAQAGAIDFASWIANEIGSTNAKMANSDQLLQRLATGQVDNLHQVMMGIEDAKLSFQLLVQVRNKLLEAYQDILRMQV